MKHHNRTVLVLFSLTVSMTFGALVLMALDKHTPSGGAYSLASYLRLDSIEEAALRPITSTPAAWNRIEVYYSNTAGGNVEDLALVSGLRESSRDGFHFVVCNGSGGQDGMIECSGNWKNQVVSNGVIRVCVVADRQMNPTTDCQIRRTTALVDTLSRNFNIHPQQIRYPIDWQM